MPRTVFISFEPNYFQQTVTCTLDDVIGWIKSSLVSRPTLVKIVYFQKHRKPPLARVKYKRASRSAA